MQTSRRHHYLPEFLLQPWAQLAGQAVAYRWDPWRRDVMVGTRSPRSVGFKWELFSLSSHPLGTDAIEESFFKPIDNEGAMVRDRMLADGTKSLSSTERSDFARVLMSLVARRPDIVADLRTKGVTTFREGLDNNPDILEMMDEDGIEGSPSNLFETMFNHTLEDHAVTMVQSLYDNKLIGNILVRSYWDLKTIDDGDGDFLIADHALIRTFGTYDERCFWCIPLSPRAALLINRSKDLRHALLKLSGGRFCKMLNRSSVNQADRFVFAHRHNPTIERWVKKRLAVVKRSGSHLSRPTP
jgi:hypothetical protein